MYKYNIVHLYKLSTKKWNTFKKFFRFHIFALKNAENSVRKVQPPDARIRLPA